MAGKCNSTGKTIYATKREAKDSMLSFKYIIRLLWRGRRKKHRMKKPVLRRAYHCEYCDGFHLTKHAFFRDRTFPHAKLRSLDFNNMSLNLVKSP